MRHERYIAHVSGCEVAVRIVSAGASTGWIARNEVTGRTIYLRTTRRLLAERSWIGEPLGTELSPAPRPRR
jgi:hypothetical protein